MARRKTKKSKKDPLKMREDLIISIRNPTDRAGKERKDHMFFLFRVDGVKETSKTHGLRFLRGGN